MLIDLCFTHRDEAFGQNDVAFPGRLFVSFFPSRERAEKAYSNLLEGFSKNHFGCSGGIAG